MSNYKYDWQIKSKIKICRECKKEFVPNNLYMKKNFFCSLECRTKNQWRLRPPIKTRKPVLKICKGCGKEFEKKKTYCLSKFNTIKFCSHKCSTDANIGIIPQKGRCSGFPSIQRGTYICSKGDHYFRSKWEANYALYLDFLVKQFEIEKWEYETDTFFFEEVKSGTRTYTPDFKIFKYDGSIEYHEVKGYMDAKSKTKLKRMTKYYPETKLILIQQDFYRDMLKKMKGIIKFN